MSATFKGRSKDKTWRKIKEKGIKDSKNFVPDRESRRKTKWRVKVRRVRRVAQQVTHGMLSENKEKKCTDDLAVLDNDQ